MCGREECIEARLRNSSDAICVSFMITIVCPITVTELIGPTKVFTLSAISAERDSNVGQPGLLEHTV